MKQIAIFGLCLISLCSQLKAQTDSLKVLLGFSPGYTTRYTQQSFRYEPLIQYGINSGNQFRYEEPIVREFLQVEMDIHALTKLTKKSTMTYGATYTFQKYNGKLNFIQNGRTAFESETIKTSEFDFSVGFVKKINLQNKLMILPEFSGFMNLYFWETEVLSDYDTKDDYFSSSTHKVFINDLQVGGRMNLWVTYRLHQNVGIGLVWYNLVNIHRYMNGIPNSTEYDTGLNVKMNPLQYPRISLLWYL